MLPRLFHYDYVRTNEGLVCLQLPGRLSPAWEQIIMVMLRLIFLFVLILINERRKIKCPEPNGIRIREECTHFFRNMQNVN